MVEAVYWFGYVRRYDELPVEKQVQVVVQKEVPDPEDPDKTILVAETETRTEYPLEWVTLPYTNPLTGETHDISHYIAPDESKVT